MRAGLPTLTTRQKAERGSIVVFAVSSGVLILRLLYGFGGDFVVIPALIGTVGSFPVLAWIEGIKGDRFLKGTASVVIVAVVFAGGAKALPNGIFNSGTGAASTPTPSLAGSTLVAVVPSATPFDAAATPEAVAPTATVEPTAAATPTTTPTRPPKPTPTPPPVPTLVGITPFEVGDLALRTGQSCDPPDAGVVCSTDTLSLGLQDTEDSQGHVLWVQATTYTSDAAGYVYLRKVCGLMGSYRTAVFNWIASHENSSLVRIFGPYKVSYYGPLGQATLDIDPAR